MNTKVFFCFVIAFVALLFVPVVNADMQCDHIWQPYDNTGFDLYGNYGLYYREELNDTGDEDFHWVVRSCPTQVCTCCGALSGYGEFNTTYLQPHAYHMKAINVDTRTDEIIVELYCHLCMHIRTEVFSLQVLADGTGNSCIQGGQCDVRFIGRKYVSEGQNFSGLIEPFDSARKDAIPSKYVVVCEDENAPAYLLIKTYMLVERVYCVRCGKPQMLIEDISFNTPKVEWPDTPVVTEDEFYTVDLPDDLLYKWLDRLRIKAKVL